MDVRSRVEQINTLEDVEIQIKRAKQYARRLHNDAKRNNITLAEKIELKDKAQKADRTFREMRRISFDLDDAIVAGLSPTSVLD